ncbi:hypothetical protein HN371_29480 [Candidatus Poribacteria bacterium]|jgi:hypothetical protein|nr:hypothetical protein [Candidatus Poribacteria bacterium]MBT5714601.1 hypothetical protein [Candidatus Poribacteria bacterium]MBT7808414.1 hypothetical protein [Candidatus Poribacteria bacterium]
MKAAVVPLAILLLMVACNSHTPPPAAQWSESIDVHHRERVVVSYRAKLDGDMLVIEATHAPDWHTYALDNVERAQEKSGRSKPETELPTRIDVTGGLRVVGNWFQSEPTDLSQADIHWYTWGFEDVAQFAAKTERAEGAQAKLLINGQACDATACSMVDRVAISLPLPSEEQFTAGIANTNVELAQLVEATTSAEEDTAAE